jgi:hypothetical protein
MKTFAEFWPFYVGEHRRPITRALHFAGSSLALVLVATGAFTGRWGLLPVALVQGYAWAWIGHFGFEKNRPATFKYPLWSFVGDWKMWSLMLTGRMGAEVKRLGLAEPLAQAPQHARQ